MSSGHVPGLEELTHIVGCRGAQSLQHVRKVGDGEVSSVVGDFREDRVSARYHRFFGCNREHSPACVADLIHDGLRDLS